MRVVRRSIGIAPLLLALLLAVAPMAAAQRMNLATATTGGAYYPAGIAVAQLLSEKIPGLQVSASTSGGSVENITLLAFNEAQMAWVQSNVLEDAYLGTGTFAGEAHPELRILVPGVENHYQMLVDRESGINSLAEWRPQEAVEPADIVVASTNVYTPVVRGEWLKPGCHVNGIGSHDPRMQELDEETIRRASVIAVDSRAGALVPGDLSIPLKQGIVRESDIVEIGLIAQGKHPGRRSAEEVTVFKSVGHASQDLVTGRMVYEKALAAGIGQAVSL